MEAGYFTQEAIPRALGGIGASVSARRWARMTAWRGLIERQALAACEAMGVPSRDAAVLVAGHGSASAPGRTLALHEHAARVGWTALFARVESACLEEAPFVAETLRGLRRHPVVVIGFFAGDGGHVRDDVPAWWRRSRRRGDQAARRCASTAPSRTIRR